MSIQDMFNTTAEVHRKTETNTNGIVSVSYAKVLDITCSIKQLSGFFNIINEKYGSQSTHRIYTTYNNNIKVGDKIISGDGSYEIERVDDVMKRGAHLQIDARLIIDE